MGHRFLPRLLPRRAIANGSQELFCSDAVSNSLVSGAGEDAFLEQVVFGAIGAVGNDFAGRGAIDSRKIQKLAFGSGVEVDQRMLAVSPTVMDPFGGRARLVGGLVSGFADLSARVFQGGLGAFSGFGDFFTSSFVPRALIGIIRIATHDQNERGGLEQRQRERNSVRRHKGS